MNENRVLVCSPCSSWQLHAVQEMTIVHGLRLRGADVRQVFCDGLYSECDIHWHSANPRHPLACTACIARQANLAKEMRILYEWLGRYLLPADFRRARRWPSTSCARSPASSTTGVKGTGSRATSRLRRGRIRTSCAACSICLRARRCGRCFVRPMTNPPRTTG
ncbi:MAG: hypothetical protein MAG453_00386 [Calditrichaeota bacterium]|nr:hypothetical protein [Calditrichota bacterium]